MSKLAIAIDGPAGAGKSTLAKAVACELQALYLDTGAMYRAMGLKVLRQGAAPGDVPRVARIAQETRVEVRYVAGSQRVLLDGEDVSEEIRRPEVSQAASQVSAVPEVRAQLVALQREIARHSDVVMDGRDIGTHVLPDATLKIFLTASPEQRALRRHLELQQKGMPGSYEQVLKELVARDQMDMSREISPLKRAEDAVELNTTDMTVEQAVEAVLQLARRAAKGAQA